MIEPPQPDVASPKQWSRRQRAMVLVTSVVLLYAVVAYLVMPWDWRRYVRRHPSLEDIPGITHTKVGIPGDPLNVALIGTETDVKKIMLAARWYPADPLTLRSCLEIADASVLKRSYDDAPVSNLYLFGRKEDLAFEQPFLWFLTPVLHIAAHHVKGLPWPFSLLTFSVAGR